MEKNSEDSQYKVSLEELLRFKRAERPDDDFWNRFDSELHQRMMQTLVKKDPWPVQILRGLSGKLAQTTAIGAAAAFLALIVVRPAFVSTPDNDSVHFAEAPASASQVAPVVAPLTDLDASLLAEADYAIEVYTADAVDSDSSSVTRDFGLDSIKVAKYDDAVYSADSAFPAFASTGVASLVY